MQCEYKVVSLNARQSATAAELTLNELGQSGWELASTAQPADSGHITTIFKRPSTPSGLVHKAGDVRIHPAQEPQ